MPRRAARATLFLLVVALLPLSFAAAQPAPQETPPFRILSTRLVTTMRDELAIAAREGYRVIAAAPPRPGYSSAPGMALLLERNPQPGDTQEYRIIAETDPFHLEQKMNQSAVEGFRVLHHSPLVKRSYRLTWDEIICGVLTEATTRHDDPDYDRQMSECEPAEMVVVMERTRTLGEAASPCLHRYAIRLAVPAPVSDAFWFRYWFQITVNPGEELLAPLWDDDVWTLAHTYGERLPVPWKYPPGPCPGTPAYEPQPPPDYRILFVRDFYALARKLGQDTAREGRVLSASSHLVNGFAVAFQRDDTRITPRVYEVLVAKKKLALKKQLADAAARGFRVVPWTLLVDRHNRSALILESQPNHAARYEYLLVNGSNERALEQATRQGSDEFRPVAFANWKGLTAVLEKPVVTLLADRPAQ